MAVAVAVVTVRGPLRPETDTTDVSTEKEMDV
jgi:hypothetical protein